MHETSRYAMSVQRLVDIVLASSVVHHNREAGVSGAICGQLGVLVTSNSTGTVLLRGYLSAMSLGRDIN